MDSSRTEEDEGDIMEERRDAELAWVMGERRVMETKQEIERIELMCNVSVVGRPWFFVGVVGFVALTF